MIKALINTGELLVGISEEEVTSMKSGRTLTFDLKDCGLPEQKITLWIGNNEDVMFEQLSDLIHLDKTKVHFNETN